MSNLTSEQAEIDDDDFDEDIYTQPKPLPATLRGDRRVTAENSLARRTQLEELKRKRRSGQLAREQKERVAERAATLPTLEEVIAEVQRQSMAGVMPTMAQFDTAKPASWATAQAHLLRLNLSWPGLAELAELKPNRRERVAAP